MALLLVQGCKGTETEDLEAGKEDHSVFIFAVDPTALRYTAEDEWKQILEQFREYYERIHPKTDVVVFLVDRQMMQSPPVWKHEFPLHLDFTAPQKHQDDLKATFPELQALLEQAWRTAHQPEKVNQPTSCLLSSLEAARKYGDGKRRQDEGVELILVLVSDLLEACDEVAPVNLEKGPQELPKLTPIQGLEIFRGVVIVQLPNHYFVRPADDRALLEGWASLLIASGVERDNIVATSGFPDDLPFE